jgi:hypothetical protein
MEQNNGITNGIAPNKEEAKMPDWYELMWEARRQKNKKLYHFARRKLGLGKHWLQQKRLSKSVQLGGGV